MVFFGILGGMGGNRNISSHLIKKIVSTGGMGLVGIMWNIQLCIFILELFSFVFSY